MKHPLPFEAQAIIAFARGTRRQLEAVRPTDRQYVVLGERLDHYRAEWERLRSTIPDLPGFDEATGRR